MPTKYEVTFIRRELNTLLLAADEAAKDRQWHAMDELLEGARRLRRILRELQEGSRDAEPQLRDSGKQQLCEALNQRRGNAARSLSDQRRQG